MGRGNAAGSGLVASDPVFVHGALVAGEQARDQRACAIHIETAVEALIGGSGGLLDVNGVHDPFVFVEGQNVVFVAVPEVEVDVEVVHFPEPHPSRGQDAVQFRAVRPDLDRQRTSVTSAPPVVVQIALRRHGKQRAQDARAGLDRRGPGSMYSLVPSAFEHRAGQPAQLDVGFHGGKGLPDRGEPPVQLTQAGRRTLIRPPELPWCTGQRARHRERHRHGPAVVDRGGGYLGHTSGPVFGSIGPGREVGEDQLREIPAYSVRRSQ
jgi:hypothetical protein